MSKNLKAREITPWVYALHADIQDAPYFEGFWPIPHGVSLNSYIVKSDKVALIDLYRDWEAAPEKMKTQMESIGIKLCDIEYLVLNHLESDHSGFLKEFRKLCPNAKIVTTKMGANLVEKYCKAVNDGETDFQNTAVQVVKTGDSLDLGQDVVLHFTETPNVHWPETMMTYEAKSKTLFSCDAFGSYGCLATKENPSRMFDDECTEEELVFFEKEAVRYYANIVASFSNFVKKAIEKLASTDIKVIAPSHGLVWRKNPKRIIDDYVRYAGYNTDGELEKEVCVIWGSMYGNTKIGLDTVIEGIEAEGVKVTVLEIPSTDPSFVLGEAYKAKGIVLAMPTYEYKMYPPMAYILNLFNRKHFSGKTALRIGSWGWVGGAKKRIRRSCSSIKMERS